METCTVAIYWVASSLDHKMCMMDFLKADSMDEYKERKKFFILHTPMSCPLLSKISPRFSSLVRLPVNQLMLRPVIYSQFILKQKTHGFVPRDYRNIWNL